jgi:transposase-like protein
MNLSEISKLTEGQAREWLERVRWPHGPVCPHCGVIGGHTRFQGKAHRTGVYKCADCHQQFSVTVKSIMDHSHIPIRTWLMAFAIICSSKKGVSALQLQRQLGLGSYRSAWHMAHRIRFAMTQEPLAGLLKGTVEVDEGYIGGKPRKKTGTAHIGRGTDKIPVLALVERGGRARAVPIEWVNKNTLKTAIHKHVDRTAKIYTDDFPAYRGIGKDFEGGHQSVRHLHGEYVRGDVSTQSVESFIGLFKRSILGSWHHVSEKHLQRYLDEATFRWSSRQISDGARTVDAIQKSAGKRLLYKSAVK